MAMNYLEKKRQEEAAQPAGLRGVSAQTQQQQQKYQGGYQPSAQTQQAQQNLAAVQQQKPQSYNSKYGAALDNILSEIQGGGDFKYSFDGDEMFKYYADLYTQNAKQGAQNAMGNAVALTGGYGNSWASAQANQAYQQAILPLYDRGMDLQQQAYQRYLGKQQNLMDRAGLLQGLDATDYGRYRDTMGDYYADLDRAQAAADNERAFDYGAYMDQLGYWQNQAKLENADYQTMQDQTLRDAALAEQIRATQADENFRQEQFGWQQATDARDYNEAVRRANLDEAYRQAQFGWQKATDARDFNEQVRQANLENDLRNRTLDWQQETDLRDYEEAVRRADQDQDYRNAMMNWQMATDTRDFNENVKRADQDQDYRNAMMNWQMATDTRDFDEAVKRADQDQEYRQQTFDESVRQANLDEDYRNKAFNEQVRQADLDEAYRQQAFDEQVRQADLDEAYRRDSMVQNQQQFEASTKLEYDQLAEQMRQFDASMSEDERQYNQKMAASWVSDILANGQIPSMELLVAAGLSYEDAQKLVAQIQTGGGPGGPGPDDKPDLKELQTQFRKNVANADFITPEERKESLEWLNKDQGPQYAPQTSNLDTPVHYTKEIDIGPGLASKTATVTTTPMAYNAMLQRMFEEDIKKSKK